MFGVADEVVVMAVWYLRVLPCIACLRPYDESFVSLRSLQASRRRGCRMKSAVAAFAFFLGLAPVALAQEPTLETEHGRFTFKQVSDGLLRLDTRTGEVALCSKRAVGWARQGVPEGAT